MENKKSKLSQAFTPKGTISKKSTVIISIIVFVILIGGWSAITCSGSVDPLFLPSPASIVSTCIDLFHNGLMSDVLITVERVMGGFLIAAVFAIPIGILVGTYAPISAIFEPLLSFIRYMPVTAFVPLFILWIGIGEAEKVAIIIVGSFPALVLMIATNIRSVPIDLIEVSYTLGTSKTSVLWKIILRKSIPDIIDTLRIVLGWAWTYVLLAEMVGASSGVGFMILQSQRMLKIGKIFVGILVIGFIGLLTDIIFNTINKIFFPWKEK